MFTFVFDGLLTHSFTGGLVCLLLSPTAGGVGDETHNLHDLLARRAPIFFAHRSGGSADNFWPNVARKTQAVVDAVMQVTCDAMLIVVAFMIVRFIANGTA
jgi:hypothetical protein